MNINTKQQYVQFTAFFDVRACYRLMDLQTDGRIDV